MDDAEPEVLAETPFLRFVRRDGWSYVQRPNICGIVGIVPRTVDGEVVLIEQYRKPLGHTVIEWPAGLAGDLPGAENEPLEAAARRELLEETGYDSDEWRKLFVGVSSPGLTDEEITFFLADNARRVSEGGGDDSEQITVHVVPLEEVDTWLAEKVAEGHHLDAKVYGGLYFLKTNMK